MGQRRHAKRGSMHCSLDGGGEGLLDQVDDGVRVLEVADRHDAAVAGAVEARVEVTQRVARHRLDHLQVGTEGADGPFISAATPPN